MKHLIWMLGALSSTAFAAENPVTLKLGKYVTFSGEQEITLISAVATAYSSSETHTVALPGCYKKKIQTGEGFPYGTTYVAFEESAVGSSTILDPNLVQIADFDRTISQVRQGVRKKVPFYCTTQEGMSVDLELKLDDGEVVKSVLFILKDSRGLYVDKPYGKAYLSAGPIDIVPTPPGE